MLENKTGFRNSHFQSIFLQNISSSYTSTRCSRFLEETWKKVIFRRSFYDDSKEVTDPGWIIQLRYKLDGAYEIFRRLLNKISSIARSVLAQEDGQTDVQRDIMEKIEYFTFIKITDL